MARLDRKKLESSNFIDRTETIVFTGAGFAEWVDDAPVNGQFKAEIVVRALTGAEIAKVREEHTRREHNRNLSDHAKNIGAPAVLVEALAMMAGEKDISPEYVRNLYVVRQGVIDPVGLTHEDVKILATRFPIEFMRIADKIMELTGLGGIDKKKVSNSTVIPGLETP